MTLDDIYEDFRSYGKKNYAKKIQMLRDLKSMNLPYSIKYDNLIQFYTDLLEG